MLCCFAAAQEDETVRIYGKVTYFNGEPVVNGIAQIRDEGFATIYSTKTDANGEYEFNVQKGQYFAFITVKDYGEKNLEFWAWNFPAYEDLEINARIDRLEVYAINAFKVQGAPGFFVYFRPMSLTKGLKYNASPEEQAKPITDIAPSLTKDSVEVVINGEKAEILDLTRVMESTAPGKSIVGYFVQPALPQGWRLNDYLHILITITDSETGEKGESSLYWEVPKYMK